MFRDGGGKITSTSGHSDASSSACQALTVCGGQAHPCPPSDCACNRIYFRSRTTHRLCFLYSSSREPDASRLTMHCPGLPPHPAERTEGSRCTSTCPCIRCLACQMQLEATVAPRVVLWLVLDSARTHSDSKLNHIPYAYLAVCRPFRRCGTGPLADFRSRFRAPFSRSASSASGHPCQRRVLCVTDPEVEPVPRPPIGSPSNPTLSALYPDAATVCFAAVHSGCAW